MSKKLLIATTNRGKILEITEILGDPELELILPGDMGLTLEVAETGATYADNARLKSVAYASVSGLIALGDDSGLEVDALGGAPGLHTARFAGPGASDADRWNLLLGKLAGLPVASRAARFRCAVAIARPNGAVAIAEGACEGRIAFAPAGSGGFGYDPVFFMPDHNCTLAELPASIKNRISHRARALLAARPLIEAAFT